MNSESKQNWDKNLNSGSTKMDYTAMGNNIGEKVGIWFKKLPNIGKTLVLVSGAILAFSLLNTIFKLITSVISLLILGLVIYMGYRFVMRTKSQS